MKTPALNSILKSFRNNEAKRFVQYLSSPFFNTNSKITDLAKCLLQQKDIDTVNYETVWKQLYGEKEYNEKYLAKLINLLNQLAQGFVTQLTYEADKSQQDVYFLKFCSNRRLIKQGNARIKKMEREEPTEHYIDAEYFLRKYYVAIYCGHLEYYQNKTSNYFQMKNDSLDRFYIVSKLDNYTSFFAINRMKQISFSEQKIDQFLTFYKHINNDFVINLYSSVLNLYYSFDSSERPKNVYFKLKNTREYLSEEEFNKNNLRIRNFLWQNVNTHNRETDMNILWNLYKDEIVYNDLEFRQKMPLGIFKNIITIALRLKKFEWTKKFIMEYENSIDSKYRKNVIIYNFANVNFYQGEFDKAIQLLVSLNLETNLNMKIYYKFDAKGLLLKCLYEKNLQSNDFLEEIDVFSINFRRSIQREAKLSSIVKERYLNMIFFIRKLMNVEYKDYINAIRLRENIENCKVMYNKHWVLAKLDEKNKKE